MSSLILCSYHNVCTQPHPEEFNDGTLTSWIPFTTPGPNPDPICSDAIYQMPRESSLIAFDNWYKNIVGEGGMTCLPTEVIEWRAPNTATVLSLGPFHCPSDYSTATTSTIDSLTTLIGCCPSDYDFNGIGLPAGRVSTLVSGALTVKSIFAPSGVWISWNDITLSTAGVSVIAIQVAGYIFNSPILTSTATSQSTSLLAATCTTGTSKVENTPRSKALAYIPSSHAQNDLKFDFAQLCALYPRELPGDARLIGRSEYEWRLERQGADAGSGNACQAPTPITISPITTFISLGLVRGLTSI